MMKQLVIGILAHVDAGKTTLSEGMLYVSGSIRKLGRVDRRDAFLDTYSQERERGITIFSKQAVLTVKNTRITLLDTPGHVDFSAEMERTLQVLDGAVLVISAGDGVQGHTLTLWRLLERYQIPVFLFINKMDQPDTCKEAVLKELKEKLDEYCVDFSEARSEEFYESIAVSGEDVLNEFLENGKISISSLQRLIRERKIFPCFFGSALKLTGVTELLEGLDEYTAPKEYPAQFGARVFKITRDSQGNRLTHMKVTGGTLRVREMLSGMGKGFRQPEGEAWEEKVNQIRVYSGEKFTTPGEIEAGGICAVTGLTRTWAGEGLGFEKETICPELSPALNYRITLPEGCDPVQMLPQLKQLEEEEPQLHIFWDEKNRELKARIMGPVQIEVYRTLIEERFGVRADFGTGSIVYKETIAGPVEGVGHFEPLRHYAEVHLLLEPGEPGSGLVTGADCSEEVLALNWQRLVLTHLEEKVHLGVLTGAPVTDMKITLKSGRAHQKHTEGGDFRQAVYRALRQGLMQAESILLEPYYEFRLMVPENMVGRAMTDLDKMQGKFTLEHSAGGTACLTGTAPMVLLQDYQQEVTAYTKGTGQLYCTLKGYFPCHNTEEVLEKTGYDPLGDTENPSSSVFCAHGAGFLVEWDKVPDYMHLESCLTTRSADDGSWQQEDYGWNDWEGDGYPEGKAAGIRGGVQAGKKADADSDKGQWIGTEEVDAIISRTSSANRKENREGTRSGWRKGRGGRERDSYAPSQTRTYRPEPPKDKYLLVDGYNVIFAWDELKELAKENLDGARGALLDILCNYQAVKKCSLIAVFDAYRLAGHPTETLDYHNIHVVYTKEAETADQYIEKFAHENSRKYDITVATSDGLEQIIIVGAGCKLISSRELKEEIDQTVRQMVEEYQNAHPKDGAALGMALSGQAAEKIKKYLM